MLEQQHIAIKLCPRLLLIPGLFSLTLLTACTEQSSLAIEEKTRFVSELIAERAECNDYWLKLSVPAKDNQALNALYEAAKAAHCLKPDV
jgi:hypothetical protein